LVWSEGLLKMLSLVLLGRPLQHPGAPRPKAASLPSSMSSQSLPELPDVATITLALRTLGSFDFEGTSFVKWFFVSTGFLLYLSQITAGFTQ